KHQGKPWLDMLTAYAELHEMRNLLATGRTAEADECLTRAALRHPAIAADLQWWAFFESFQRRESRSRPAFWRAMRGLLHVCRSPALPFAGARRRSAAVGGFEAAAAFARVARLRP